MKQFIQSFMLLALIGLGAVSCNNVQEKSVVQPVDKTDARTTQLSTALQEIMNSKQDNLKQGGYIIYDAETDSIAVLDPHGYSIFRTLKQGIEKGGGTVAKLSTDPEKEGWSYAGECDSKKESAFNLLHQKKEDLLADQSFEIYLKRQENGLYKVWYRIATPEK